MHYSFSIVDLVMEGEHLSHPHILLCLQIDLLSISMELLTLVYLTPHEGVLA